MAGQLFSMGWWQFVRGESVWMGGGADWGWARFLSFDWVEAGDGAGGAWRSGVYGGEVVFVNQRKKIVVGRVVEDVFVPAVLYVKALDVSATIAK